MPAAGSPWLEAEVSCSGPQAMLSNGEKRAFQLEGWLGADFAGLTLPDIARVE